MQKYAFLKLSGALLESPWPPGFCLRSSIIIFSVEESLLWPGYFAKDVKGQLKKKKLGYIMSNDLSHGNLAELEF